MSGQPYTIDHGNNSRRKAVEDWLFGLDLVTPSFVMQALQNPVPVTGARC